MGQVEVELLAQCRVGAGTQLTVSVLAASHSAVQRFVISVFASFLFSSSAFGRVQRRRL